MPNTSVLVCHYYDDFDYYKIIIMVIIIMICLYHKYETVIVVTLQKC